MATQFETQEQAYEDALVQYEGTSMGTLLSPDIFSDAFRVNLVNPDQADIIIDQISSMPGVDEVTDQRAYLEPIFSIINTISFSAVGIAALMLVAAVLLIATTIRLSAFSRRREISIMRLVGASNRFIQTPFILEGVLAALIGAALAGVAVVLLVQFFVRGLPRGGRQRRSRSSESTTPCSSCRSSSGRVRCSPPCRRPPPSAGISRPNALRRQFPSVSHALSDRY